MLARSVRSGEVMTGAAAGVGATMRRAPPAGAVSMSSLRAAGRCSCYSGSNRTFGNVEEPSSGAAGKVLRRFGLTRIT